MVNKIITEIIHNVPAIAVLISAIALVINARQFFKNTKVYKLSIVTKVLSDFSNNKELQKSFYTIEYSSFIYSTEFHGSDIEKEVDSLLRHFSTISLAWEANQLSIKDIEPIAYYIHRIISNQEIRKYLDFLSHWIETANYKKHPYLSLLNLYLKLEKDCIKKKDKSKILPNKFYKRNHKKSLQTSNQNVMQLKKAKKNCKKLLKS